MRRNLHAAAAAAAAVLLARLCGPAPAAWAAATPDPAAHPRPARALPTPAELFRSALAARDGKDYPAYLALLRQVVALRPRNPDGLREIARGYALNSQPDSACLALERLLRLQVDVDTALAPELQSLRASQFYPRLLDQERRFLAWRGDLFTGEPEAAFTMDDPELAPEGLTSDPASGAFFVGSIRKRKIVRVQGNSQTDFVGSGAEGLWGVYGMAVDAQRRRLWAGTTASPENQGYVDSLDGVAGLFEFDLDTGKLLGKWWAPRSQAGHNFNDVALAPDGTVYVSDSREGALYRLDPQRGALDCLVPPGHLYSPQGMAVSWDAQRLIVADYPRELYRVDVATGEVAPIPPARQLALFGVDGLAGYGNTLFATQNGVQPNKVVRIEVDPESLTVREAHVLDMHDPRLGEPTLGVVSGGWYYFIANSSWAAFTPDRRALVPGKAERARILRIRVGRGR